MTRLKLVKLSREISEIYNEITSAEDSLKYFKERREELLNINFSILSKGEKDIKLLLVRIFETKEKIDFYEDMIISQTKELNNKIAEIAELKGK